MPPNKSIDNVGESHLRHEHRVSLINSLRSKISPDVFLCPGKRGNDVEKIVPANFTSDQVITNYIFRNV